jgi:hypothetical protein
MSGQQFHVDSVDRRYDCAAREVGDSHDEGVNGFLRPKPGTAEQLPSTDTDAGVIRSADDRAGNPPQ